MASPQGMQEGFVTLWAGEDPALHAKLLDELRAAGIAYVDRSIGDEDTSSTDPFFVGQSAMFGFHVAVHSSTVSAAETILERLLDEEPEDVELAEGEAFASQAGHPPAAVGDATCTVWSGSDQAQANFLVQALKENEIPVRVGSAGEETIVFVPPAEETLAREIVREILEGAPPA